MIDVEVKKEFNRINEKLTSLIQVSKKQTWASAHWVTKLTGWDGKELDSARKQNIIQFRKNNTGGYDYLLESIPSIFIKKEIA